MARIVLVDDHEDVRTTLVRYLERVGHVVRPFASAREAVGAPGLESADLVLLDWVEDAEEVVRHARAFRPPVPVLMLTGQPEKTSGALDLGVTRVIFKPLTMTELSEAIQEILGEAEGDE